MYGTDGQAGRQAGRQTDSQASRQADRQISSMPYHIIQSHPIPPIPCQAIPYHRYMHDNRHDDRHDNCQ